MNMVLIRKNNEKNYLFFREKDNKYSLSGFKVFGNKQYDLDVDIVKEFDVFKLGNNIKKIGYEDGYNVVLDVDTGFKHYVKDGKFDYRMFYLNNGEDATLCSGSDNDGQNKLKRFAVNGVEFLVDSFVERLVPIILAAGVVLGVGKCLKIPEITAQGVYEYISSSSKLTEVEKEFLNNERLIEDVVRYASGKPATIMLKNRLDGMEIVNFSDEVRLTADTISAGYYSFNNELYVYNYDSSDFSSYKKVISHEFIHMLQADEEYRYLAESSAELMSCEYFDCEVNSYVEEVKRLRVLMEIIGSESIKEYNFAGESVKFLSSVRPYLGEEDYKSFIEIMCYDPARHTYEENNVVNKQLDSIFGILYKNKFGKDISTDKVINAIYNGEFIYNYMEKTDSEYDIAKYCNYQRYYFNSDLFGDDDNYLYCYDMVTMDLKEAYDEDKILIRDKVYWEECDYDSYLMNKEEYFVSINGCNEEMDEYWTSYINEDGQVVLIGEIEKVGLSSIWEKFSEQNYDYQNSSLEYTNQEYPSQQVNVSNKSVSKSLKLVRTRGNN